MQPHDRYLLLSIETSYRNGAMKISSSKSGGATRLVYPLSVAARLLVAERPAGDPAARFTERHLQAVWFDERLRPANLETIDGEPVRVAAPGRWNLEAGPDFTDAALIVGTRQRHLHGSVEIHVRPSDWQQHQHRHDPRYREVVAHVTYYPGPLPEEELPPGTIIVALRDALKASPTFAFENIDLAAYPFAIRRAATACASLLAQRSPDDWEALLEAAGIERLRRRMLLFEQQSDRAARSQLLYEECMTALGYKLNKAPMRLLARRVHLSALRNESGGDTERAYALLAGVAGLLPENLASGWDDETRAAVRRWWNYWWKQRGRWSKAIIPRSAWTFAGQRPANQPLRRLMAAAILFGGAESLTEKITSIDPARPDSMERAAALLRQANGGSFWSSRLGLKGERHKKAVALLGEERISAITANVSLPFILAANLSEEQLLGAAARLLAPEADNALIRQMAFNLFGRDHNPALYRTGLRQQGLLHLFHEFCLPTRAGCADCRLPATLAELFSGWGNKSG